MIFNKLSLPEMKLIEKCAIMMIESLERIARESHPLFEEFYEAYKNDGDSNKLDIGLITLQKIELWESIKEYPSENLPKLDSFDMLIVRMIFSDKIQGLDKSRKTLLDKIDMYVRFTDTTNEGFKLN